MKQFHFLNLSNITGPRRRDIKKVWHSNWILNYLNLQPIIGNGDVAIRVINIQYNIINIACTRGLLWKLSPLETTINLGVASVDASFLGVTISNVILSCIHYWYSTVSRRQIVIMIRFGVTNAQDSIDYITRNINRGQSVIEIIQSMNST